jgi:serine/threonine protein phosphatase PrpC
MRVGAKAFWLPKAGNAPEEYEDACYPKRAYTADADMARFAVADGASETSFSKHWAELLVEAYSQGKFKGPDVRPTLDELSAQWQSLVKDKPLPWYAEEKLQMGAYASLLGLTVKQTKAQAKTGGTWQALAVGDSCLFHVRQDSLLTAFPLERSDQFNNRPVLLPTKLAGSDEVIASFSRRQGEWEYGDIFYLMTDAMAAWLLRRYEVDGTRLVCRSDLATAVLFARFVEEERKLLDADGRSLLRNDDVTVVQVDLSRGAED